MAAYRNGEAVFQTTRWPDEQVGRLRAPATSSTCEARTAGRCFRFDRDGHNAGEIPDHVDLDPSVFRRQHDLVDEWADLMTVSGRHFGVERSWWLLAEGEACFQIFLLVAQALSSAS
jgi:hypothetical protein